MGGVILSSIIIDKARRPLRRNACKIKTEDALEKVWSRATRPRRPGVKVKSRGRVARDHTNPRPPLNSLLMRRPPGPPTRFLIGNLPLFDPDPLAIYTRWAREFGDIFYYRAGWMDVYFLNHPSLIEQVLVSQSQNFAKDKVIQNSRWI